MLSRSYSRNSRIGTMFPILTSVTRPTDISNISLGILFLVPTAQGQPLPRGVG